MKSYGFLMLVVSIFLFVATILTDGSFGAMMKCSAGVLGFCISIILFFLGLYLLFRNFGSGNKSTTAI